MSQTILPIQSYSDSLVRQVRGRAYANRFVSRFVFLAGRIFLSHLSFSTPPKMSPAPTAWMPDPVDLERPPSSTAWMPVLVKDLCDPDVVATIAKRR